MKIIEISPFVRQAIVSKMSLGLYTSYKLRTRDHRLFYVLGGSGSIVIEGVSYAIRPGMLVLFRSGTEYIWQVSDMRYIGINFDYTRAHTHLTRSFHVNRSDEVGELVEPGISFSDAELLNSPIVIYEAASFESALMNVVTEFAVKGKLYDEYVSALLKGVIISIARGAEAEVTGTRAGGVREIISYIQANYNKPIRNTDIADALHFNPSYMNRLFKSRTGITLRAFLIDYRINAAIDIIMSTDSSVSEVAMAVGFSDVPHFIKTFKAHTGKTPTEYRKG